MKKLFVVLGLVLVIGGIGYKIYDDNYGGTSYYVKIAQDGERKDIKTDSGDSFSQFFYKVSGYDKVGNEKELELSTVLDAKPIKKGAFLEVIYNNKKGVISWREVERTDIPRLAKEKLGS